MTSDRSTRAVVIRSRVRFARNIVDYPFPPVLDTQGRNEIIEKVDAALNRHGYTKLEEINTPLGAKALSERNLISREFAGEKEARALFANADRSVCIMVCEEDHLRIQGFADGFDLEKAFNAAKEAEQILGGAIRFAFDKELGYLTHCPTNLGTAMRASVMLFLPGLTMANRMGDVKSELDKIGMTIRGIYGEGSKASAYMYQISNRLSLGICESDILQKTEHIIKQIAEEERKARAAVFEAAKTKITDKVRRSLGILKYAYAISAEEFLSVYADVRLGIDLGLVDEVDCTTLDRLLPAMMPANLISENQAACSTPASRDVYRAKRIREALA